ncbi:hypothetical protein [Actinomadura sediminis]|uniref:DivIVA domain-containing protein n=1 Tax=Actinomadura sediminis TaxID=1038904 RepID=A0ABW3ELT6_9ACTN
MIVLVVLGLAAVAVLGAVVVLAMGRGGELAATHPDHPQLTLGADGWPITQADVAYLRLPRTLWGYQPDLTDEAVRRFARVLADRDAEIDALRRENAALRLRGGESVGALYGLRESTGPTALPSDEVPPDAGEPRDDRTADRAEEEGERP